MTLSQQLIQRGKQEGLQQGMQQGLKSRSYDIAKKMLISGEFSVELIASITDLSVDYGTLIYNHPNSNIF